ncbi:MAG: ATP-binding protein [Burkholderiaceae bacterium]
MNLTIDETDGDLSACSREQIHIPGSIQPHGFLLGLDERDLRIVQASDNVAHHLGKDVDALLGGALSSAIGSESATMLLASLEKERIRDRLVYMGTIALGAGRFFDVMAHATDGLLILEFEEVARNASSDFRLLHPLVTSFVIRLSEAESVEHLSALAAEEIKELTGYGRVLLYRFDHHGHGQVLAEARDEQYHSHMGQRFPASDIPVQARALYLKNRIRLIPDANYRPSLLVPSLNPKTGKPTDLSYSSLRSVSPVHVHYMKNMDTLSSMSISIVIKGKLWGLISCHDVRPKFVHFEARAACEQLAQILALRIESKEEGTENLSRLELRRMLVSMLANLSHNADLLDGMASISHDLLRFANASGAALLFEGNLVRYGDLPSEAQILDLVQWLGTHVTEEVFVTDSLSTQYPPAQDYRHNGSGILALSISKIHRHYLIWFRPEVIQTIDWAGNPHLKVGKDESGRLTPRASFELWRETVLGLSLPWSRPEIDTALEFRTALLGIVLKRAEQMAELAEELGRANKELEAFSYSVSHDLRAPLRHIVGFADLLLEFEKNHLSERGTRFLHNIKSSANFAGKLVDDLLSFSQMGRAALRVRRVDMDDLVRAIVEKLKQETRNEAITWKIDPLPEIDADPAFLQLAIYNLLSNAIKYSRNREHPVISVSAEQTASETLFHFADNGVGFNMDYAHKLFGVFQRLHRMEEFEGTGIGLANVKRIVERHGGRVWAKGEPNEGAVFSITVPKQLILTDGDKYAETDTAG